MRGKRIAAVGLAGAVLSAGLLVGTTGVAGAAPRRPARCVTTTDDKWPGWVDGRPAHVDPHTASGVYMWHDGKGWHVRATHRAVATQNFSGTITTTGRFFGVSSVRLEGHDWRHVSADHRTITFSFANHGAIDGLNFVTHCASSITFSFQSDGQPLPAASVTIGLGGTKPATDPFTVSRS